MEEINDEEFLAEFRQKKANEPQAKVNNYLMFSLMTIIFSRAQKKQLKKMRKKSKLISNFIPPSTVSSQMEDMRKSMLAQVLSPEARERCNLRLKHIMSQYF
jgi:hypothetical protein